MSVGRRAEGLVALAMALSVCGCTSAARAEPAYVARDAAAQEDFDRARAAWTAGRPEEAERGFSAFVATHREDPLRHGAELHLGRIAASRGRHDEAVTWLELAALSTDPTLSTTARRELGTSLLALGRPGRALEVLEPLTGRLDGAEAATLYGTLAEAARAAGDGARALRYLDARHRFERDGAARLLLEGQITATAAALEPDALEALHGALPRTGAGWAAATGRLAELVLALGDETRARALLRALEAAGAATSPTAAALRATLDEVARVDWSAIGVLIPGSGRARLVGEQVLEGLELATEARAGAGGRVRLVVRDTEGADVARLVDELAGSARVAAIVGPVDTASATAAARRAQELGVPLLALTIEPGVTGAGDHVLRPFHTNEAEVEALVDEAIGRGLRSFAVLAPDHGYGRTMRRLFEAAVVRAGGRLVASRTYPPGTTSFVEVCRELSPASFEALFLPDSSRAATLVAPALAAAGLFAQPAGRRDVPSGTRPVQLLLPAAAFDESLVRRAGRYLQGALVATPFWAGDTSPEVSGFVERFVAARGRPPSSWASQGHDAVRILEAARARTSTRTRRALLEALLRLEGAETAGPFAGFLPSGEPRTPVRLLTVEGDGFRGLDR